jgi:hypothetical protein
MGVEDSEVSRTGGAQTSEAGFLSLERMGPEAAHEFRTLLHALGITVSCTSAHERNPPPKARYIVSNYMTV